MQSFINKFDNLILFIRQKTSWFVYSCFMPLITGLLLLLFWIADLQILAFLSTVLMTCFVLIVYDDLLPISILMLMVPMGFRNPTLAFEQSFVPCVIIFGILVLSLIFHFVKYPIKKIELDKFFFVILGIVGIFLIGGLFSGNSKHYFDGIGIFLMSGIVPLVIHFFFYNNVKLDTKIDIRKYLCMGFIIAISIACAELCYAKLYAYIYDHAKFGYVPGGFCWANSNHIASLVLIAVPLCCYMMLSSSYVWAWFVEVAFLYISLFVSGSDGGFATLGIFSPFLIYAVCKDANRKNLPILKFVFYWLVAGVILAVAYLFLFEKEELLSFISSSSSDTGRSLPYEMAVKFFLFFPVFGIGLGGGHAKLVAIENIAVYNGFYHSTFFHILACTGAVGIISYVIYYIARIKYLLNKDTLLGKFTFYAFCMFALYGLIENNEFNIVLMFMTTLITIVGLINKKGSDDKPLPLWIKIPNFCSLNQSCK